MAGSCLLRCAVGDLTQDDHTSTLAGPDLLSTWSHLNQRQGCKKVHLSLSTLPTIKCFSSLQTNSSSTSLCHSQRITIIWLVVKSVNLIHMLRNKH